MTTCERCNGSGEVARSIYYPCSYVGPGPVPEYAAGVYGAPCDECEGTGKAKVCEVCGCEELDHRGLLTCRCPAKLSAVHRETPHDQ